MKRKFSRILRLGVTLFVVLSLTLAFAPAALAGEVSEPDITVTPDAISTDAEYVIKFDTYFGLDASSDYGTLDTEGTDGTAEWSTVAHSGSRSAKLGAGTAGGANVGRVRLEVSAIPMTSFTGATFWVWEPTGTEHGGTWPTTGIGPYGDPYINILIDTTGDGNFDDKLEGVGSITVGSTSSPATHPTPTAETWVQMEEGYGFYDQDDSMAAGLGTGTPWTGSGDASTLAEWKAWFAAYEPTWTVVGVEITFGYWLPDVTKDVYVDDITINSTTYNLDPDTITVRFPSGTTFPSDEVYTPDSILVSIDGGTTYTSVGTGNATLNKTTRVLVISVPVDIPDTTHVAVKITKACEIQNPDLPGDYTLEVKTTEETTYKPSEVYTIGVPGMVTRYNDDGNFVGSYNSIQEALDEASDEDTLRVGPGTYVESINVADEELTIEATGTAAETVIKGAVTIDEDETTIDGLTLKGTTTVSGAKCIIQNSVFTKKSTSGETQLTISGNTTKITDCTFDTRYKSVFDTAVKITEGDSITIDGCIFTSDEGTTSNQDIAIDVAASAAVVTSLTVKNCTFDGTKGTGYQDVSANKTTVTVKDNSFDGFERAFLIDNTATGSTLTIRVNTITDSTKSTYGAIEVDGATEVVIVGNTIEDNAGYSVLVDGNQDKVTVIGNNLVDNVKGLKSTMVAPTAEHLKAENNWWGDASGPAGEGDGSGDKVSTYVDYEPYLATSISAGQTALDATSLDAKTVASVKVSGLTDAADLIWAAKYESNPEDVEPTYTALEDAWFDVYIGTGAAGTATIKLYSDDIDADTDAYAWSGLKNKWLKCEDQGASASGGYVWVNVGDTDFPTLDDMGGLPFVLVDAPAAAKTKFELTAPDAGATVPILTNVPFTWKSYEDADSYDLVISPNPDLSAPLVEESIAGTAYIYAGTLTDGTPYYWQVTGMRGDTVKARSDVSTFIAKVPVEAVTPEVTVEPAITVTVPDVTVEAPVITVTPPDITVEAAKITVEAAPAPVVTVEAPPAAAPAVPDAMLWIIIGIGAVLVIALIVLIVRTRRVA